MAADGDGRWPGFLQAGAAAPLEFCDSKLAFIYVDVGLASFASCIMRHHRLVRPVQRIVRFQPPLVDVILLRSITPR
jgi:hypothetical protein